jgi:hypothetical protein
MAPAARRATTSQARSNRGMPNIGRSIAEKRKSP